MYKLFLLLMHHTLSEKRNLLIKQHLQKDMTLIADFGCGHFPNKYANILIDQITSQDEQRGGLKITKPDSKIFYNMDLNIFPYPFPDKYFDFTICSHVLEHLEDPVQTCSEFSRISKAGYLEVPFYCVDMYIRNNNAIHKWLCAYEPKGQSIYFIDRKSFMDLLPPRSINIFLRFILQFKNISLVWKEKIHANYLTVGTVK